MNDVHLIAYYYHWTERDILSLSVRKRAKYIELITEQIARENGEDDDPIGGTVNDTEEEGYDEDTS